MKTVWLIARREMATLLRLAPFEELAMVYERIRPVRCERGREREHAWFAVQVDG